MHGMTVIFCHASVAWLLRRTYLPYVGGQSAGLRLHLLAAVPVRLYECVRGSSQAMMHYGTYTTVSGCVQGSGYPVLGLQIHAHTCAKQGT